MRKFMSTGLMISACTVILTGCLAGTNIVSRSPTHISLSAKSGLLTDSEEAAGKMAEEHCLEHDKFAKLESFDEKIYKFACVDE
jgi:hypothetical protein